MHYRQFGKTGWQVSILGFGAMRLPTLKDNIEKVDEEEAIRMMRYAFDNGVNYIDTAYMYHMGESEKIVGKALKGYRERVKLATKLPVRMLEKKEDCDRIFNEQMQKLDVDKIDFYLFHGLNHDGWQTVKEYDAIKWAEGLKAKGLIGGIGFSFHDELPVFREIIDSYDDWILAQVQYNFMDVVEQAGQRGVKYAAERGIPIVVMEPLHGGLLARKPPKPVAEIWASAPVKKSPVAWAFQWLWSQPEVTVTLSGMSAMEQVKENISLANNPALFTMTREEQELMTRARNAYRSLRPIKCTGCRYCMPCPNGVDIPGVFQIYDDAMMYEDINMGIFRYNGPFGINQNSRGDKCIACGECLEKCPAGIDIPGWLKKVHEALYRDMPVGPSEPSTDKKD